ncbi:MAG: type II toxin-antitoxin system RelE/ParE family toxin [Elusimicrobiota bacterium]|nr:type II toxin-antitoxin system RelE/ParE family toxin [Elusimicrobiota bacterium]
MKQPVASNHFLKFKKRSPRHIQLEIDRQVVAILKNPGIGELKKGALKGIRVLKFKYKTQQYLLSYKEQDKTLYLYTIGSHENYYSKLKQFLH